MQKVLRSFLSILMLATLFSTIQLTQSHALTTVAMSDTDSLVFDHTKAKNIKGTGTTAGDIVLYPAVGAFNGVVIDAVVTTVSIPSGSISNYDNPGSASTATGSGNYFQLNTVGGSTQVQFDFYVGGTYTVQNSGSPVILQNVRIATIDLDCSSSAGSYQYSDFTGFQAYTLTSDTNLTVIPLAGGAGARFQANKTGSRSAVPQDQALVRYTSVQSLKVTFGNVISGSTNYFGLIFGPWSGGGTPVENPNIFNTPPTSSNTTQYVPATATTIVPLSSFGNFSDVDNNPFVNVKISALPALGSLTLSGVAVTAGQVITTADIDAGKLKYVSSALAADQTVTFYVQDGQDYSTASYTLTLKPSTNSQIITFPGIPTQTPGVTLASNAVTSATGLTVTLTSNTPGICTVSGLDINTIANGTCIIVATQAGNSTYAAATPVTQTFLVASGLTQTITFNAPSQQTAGATVASGAVTSASGLTVTLTSLTPSVCIVSGLNIITLTAGVCKITASQPGDGTYAPATSVTQQFNVVAPATTAVGIAARSSGVGLTYNGSSTTTYLNGRIDQNGNAVTYQFCYTRASTVTNGVLVGSSTYTLTCVSTDASPATTSALASSPNKDVAVVSRAITGLSTSKYYYYQIVAWITGSATKAYGTVIRWKSPSSSSSPHGITSDATALAQTTATLNGTARVGSTSNGNGKVNFCISTTFTISSSGAMTTCDQIIASTDLTSTSSAARTGSATGLLASTTYYYQIYVTQAGSNSTSFTHYGNIVSFMTSAMAPTATTAAATSITNTTATLNGSIMTYGPATDAKFCWGTTSPTTSCTPVVASPTSVSGSSASSISLGITGLTQGTTYYFRAVAVRNGTSYFGNVLSFIPGSPLAATLAATSVSATGVGANWQATLNGYVNSLGATAEAFFCYSTSATVDAAGKLGCASLTTASPSTTTSTANESVTLSTLTANTTYYFQVVARNQAVPTLITYGQVYSFITSAAPSVTTSSASSVTATTATINGSVTANGASTTPTFCLATSNTTDDSGVLQSCIKTVSGGNATTGSAVAISNALTGLTGGTIYYFQAIGENTRGTTYGSVLNFTTLALPIATTAAATSIASTSATLNGSSSANSNVTTTVKFCLATDPTVGPNGALTCSSTFTLTPTITGNGTTSFTQSATGLTSGTAYYFQIYASNTQGTTYGSVYSFIPGGATVTTSAVSGITTTSAVLNGTANKQTDSGVNAYLCISTSSSVSLDGSLNCDVQLSTATSITTTGNVSITFTTTNALNPGTTYYVQAYVTGNAGNNYGAVVTFTTNPTVTYNSNGGDGGGPMATQNVASGTSITLANNNYTRTRYTFAGWATSPTGSVVYANGANFTLNGNLTLYAIWTSTGYIVKFDSNGGTGAAMSDQTSTTAVALTQNTYTRTNYAFTGWSSVKGGSVDYADKATYAFTADITLYAVWVAQYNIVQFLSNGGAGTMPSQSANGTVALNSNTFTRTNYVFAGWATSSSGVKAYDDGSNFGFGTATSPATVYKLYALWTSTKSIVKFYSNGGSGSMDDQLVTPITGADPLQPFSTNLFTRDNYTFKGWSTDPTSSTVTYTNGQLHNFATNLNLYAVWGGVITYYAGLGSGSVPTDGTVYLDDQSATLKSGTPNDGTLTLTGYSFAGWSLNPDGSGTLKAAGSQVKMAGNLNLYAVYAAYITYLNTGATGGSVPVDPTAYSAGAIATILGNTGSLVKTDWDFDGWLDENGNPFNENDMPEIKGNITLHPHWSTNTKAYQIIYHPNGPTASDITNSGRTTTSFTIANNTFTYSGYAFSKWADTATCDEADTNILWLNPGDSINVVNDPTNVEVYACWTVAVSSGGSGRGTVGGTTGGTTATPSKKLPIFTGKVVNIVPPKVVAANQIVPVKQVITLTLPPVEIKTVEKVLVNGQEVKATIGSNGQISTSVIIGPKDKVTVVAKDNVGEDVSAQVALQLQTYSLANVNFDLASAKLTSAAKQIIIKAAQVIKAHGFTQIDLAGHTDIQGGQSYDNQTLSDARAASVAAYLKAQLKGSNVKVITSGKAYKELASTGTDTKSNAINRRVEIVVK